MGISVMAFFAGAPWAYRVWFWTALPAYTLLGVCNDAAIVFAHRYCFGIKNETVRGTLERLLTPNAHWPSLRSARRHAPIISGLYVAMDPWWLCGEGALIAI